ncbi:MAG: hypothetical protein SVR94_17295 [Pseudomonadota bacterium]|nr:hypothetical protein [Pseudomonadota bacterium]
MRLPQHNAIEKLFMLFSHIKVSKRPLFLAYKPQQFALKGIHTREIMQRVKPGDILVRAYNDYLDNYFLPGTFNHVGFYLGTVTEAHLKQIAQLSQPNLYQTGEQMVIHALGQQLYLDNLIDFCRCDGLAIMRFPRQIKSLNRYSLPESLQAYFKDPQAPKAVAMPEEEIEAEEEAAPSKLKKFLPKKLSKKSKVEPVEATPVKLDALSLKLIKNEHQVAQHIAQGKAIEFEKVFKLMYQVALKELSTPYHYDFGMDNFRPAACSEFVFFVTKSICWNYGIEAESQKILFQPHQVILPDTFVDSDLEEIWKEVR